MEKYSKKLNTDSTSGVWGKKTRDAHTGCQEKVFDREEYQALEGVSQGGCAASVLSSFQDQKR